MLCICFSIGMGRIVLGNCIRYNILLGPTEITKYKYQKDQMSILHKLQWILVPNYNL